MPKYSDLPLWTRAALARVRVTLRRRQISSFTREGHVVVPQKENRRALQKLVKEMGVSHEEVTAPRNIAASMPAHRLHPYFVAVSKLLARSPLELPPEQEPLVIHDRSEPAELRIKIGKRYHV